MSGFLNMQSETRLKQWCFETFLILPDAFQLTCLTAIPSLTQGV